MHICPRCWKSHKGAEYAVKELGWLCEDCYESLGGQITPPKASKTHKTPQKHAQR